jgi:hypothetical protein
VAEGRVCMWADKRAKVNAITSRGDGAGGGRRRRGQATVLRAFFFSDMSADGLKAAVKRLILEKSLAKRRDDKKKSKCIPARLTVVP